MPDRSHCRSSMPAYVSLKQYCPKSLAVLRAWYLRTCGSRILTGGELNRGLYAVRQQERSDPVPQRRLPSPPLLRITHHDGSVSGLSTSYRDSALHSCPRRELAVMLGCHDACLSYKCNAPLRLFSCPSAALDRICSAANLRINYS